MSTTSSKLNHATVATAAMITVLLVAVLGSGAIVNAYRCNGEACKAWVDFGTYFGGLAGPVFGLAAFLAAMGTVVMQARQMDELRQQRDLDELQRALSSMSDRLDEWLDQRPDVDPIVQEVVPSERLKEIVARAAGRLAHPHEKENRDEYLARAQYIADAFSTEFSEVRNRVDDLAWCMNRYRARGGSEDVLQLYRRKHLRTAAYLAVTKQISRSSLTFQAFGLSESASVMRIYGD